MQCLGDIVDKIVKENSIWRYGHALQNDMYNSVKFCCGKRSLTKKNMKELEWN